MTHVEELRRLLRLAVDEGGPKAVMVAAGELAQICQDKSRGLVQAKAKDPASLETDALQRWANLASRFTWAQLLTETKTKMEAE